MMPILDNLRLRDLAAIVKQNQLFYEDFCRFLISKGYDSIYAFVSECSDEKAILTLESYLAISISDVKLYDGIGRPYEDNKAKWYFLAWIMRDAPAQRLEPLLRSLEGDSLAAKKAFLINHLRKFVGPLFPDAINWTWPVLSEVMLSRLEGSRRALKGTQFEDLVRGVLRSLFLKHQLKFVVGDKEKRINNETYDIQITYDDRTILLPVKTRETMGGGHANLFTRDIFKAISVAQEAGFFCIPVVIAESWSGNLDSLNCESLVYIKTNPNQILAIEAALYSELDKLIPVFKAKLLQGEV
ncbi:MAG TPA: hypothetical protein PLD30_16350 [Candidatus Competibacteraceae bacterium]|nr:hypothetical protein [Candidatus Competibacter sp.]MDG4604730.1 hypothetical protein [Candidatus Contendobacter sp.]HRD48000.1 hypothetical protein [Candidatus Contendobacter sp.]HRF45779.1 hypothetical protein [Candidatus Competibacteraceae bacterium]